MRSIIIPISLILIVANVLAGLILKDFHKENVVASSCVLLINAILLLVIANMKMKDAFKISFFILFPFFCMMEYILAVLSPNTIDNNLYAIGIMGCFVFQLILFFTGLMRR